MLKKLWHSVTNYLKHTDAALMALALLICIVGLVLIYSGCQPVAKVRPPRVMMVQCMGIGMGFVGLILLSFCDFKRIPWLWIVAAVFNVLFQLSLQFLGKTVGGNKSWIPLPGGLNIQPGEVGKIIFIFTMASHMDLLKERRNSIWTLIQWVAHMGITMVAVYAISHDLGVALMYPLIFLAMLIASGVSPWWLGAAGLCAGGAIPLMWKFVLRDDQKLRILSVANPAMAEAMDAKKYAKYSYQGKQTVLAVGNGQLTGKGYLHGTRVQGTWVPESHTDSIFTTCAEELGFIGCLVLLLLLTALVIRIYQDAYRSTDYFSSLLCVGVGSMFMWQIGINVGMNLGIFPVIGLTLPLVSYGGTSVMTTLASLGLVCGAIRRIKPNWIRSPDD